jgi:cob(I)alamin adenosyltransferase
MTSVVRKASALWSRHRVAVVARSSSRTITTATATKDPTGSAIFESYPSSHSFVSSKFPESLPSGRTRETSQNCDHTSSMTMNTTTSTAAVSASTTTSALVDIEDLHQQALAKGLTKYVDPPTGFTVFTELIHLKRGTCCGNQCRHCPYGWENVNNVSAASTRPIQKVTSGDFDATDVMVQQILAKANQGGGGKSSSATITSRRKYNTPVTDAASTTDSATSPTTTPKSRTATTKKNVPYTRTGDRGTSQLLTGERRRKDDSNFEALGTVDELCSFVGVCHAHLNPDCEYGELSEWLLEVQSRLFDVGSHVAKPRRARTSSSDSDSDSSSSSAPPAFNPDGIGGGLDPIHTTRLEEWINAMTEELPELTSFILPTGAKAAAHLHVARTVCRRAERRMVPLVEEDQTCDPNALKYVNRLSDFLFTAARWVNFCEGKDEILYRQPARRNTSDTTSSLTGVGTARPQRSRVTRSLQLEEEENK